MSEHRPYEHWSVEQIRHQLALLDEIDRLREQLRQQSAEGEEQQRQAFEGPGRPAA
jgi:hypothetical protein